MNSKLLLKVRTVDEKEKLASELSILMDSLYKNKGDGLDSALNTQVRQWVAELVREEAGQDLNNINNYLKTVNSNLEKLKILNLTLAFEPTEASIDKIIKTIRESGDLDIILDFSYEPKILGGAIISYKGEYRDLSLKRVYEAEYEEKEKEVMKIVYSK